MVYQLNTGNYKNLEKFRENILQPRSYFIPFASRDELEKTDICTERFQSSRVAVLSGKWQFKYFARCTEIPEEFDTDETEMEKISVPSTWQRTGYEDPVYPNTRYPFQVEPPAIPQDCPAGVYVKKFALDEVSGNYTLTFLGAASCLDLFVNGKHVGYSEGSHNSAEFLLNDLLQTGVNEIVAVVYKWCNGSYLECQDMFRENGIFRDVLLTRTGENAIYDFHVKTDKNENNTYNLSIMPVFRLADECTFHAWLMDGDSQIAEISKTVSGVEACATTFNTLDVEQWSAELPKLYQLYLSLEKDGEVLEVIRRNVGFKTVAVKGPVFYFNGRNITIKGVNHHDSHPETGYVMRVEDLERDVRLMKEFNCNAVRTSHYPPDPIFLDLCDQYGLYVIDEADIETHGTGSIGRPNLLSNNEDWKEHYWDRVLRMYQRDKNHPAITMWSLGNESGGRKNQDYCYQNLKQLTAVPIHYEGVIHTSRIGYDVVSSMYGSPDNVERIGRKRPVFAYPYLKCGAQLRKKPFFLCEYAHAMGVGAGSLEEYVQAFYKYDNLLGGCIWEFADHAVAHEDGPYRYTYGGDHGERIHDGNFCVDGLFYPDRRPHTGAYQMRCVYRPVRAARVDDHTFRFTNMNSFATANDITVKWEIVAGGYAVENGIFPLAIQPGESQEIKIAYQSIAPEADNAITFVYHDKVGGEIAREQLILTQAAPVLAQPAAGEITVSPVEKKVLIRFRDGRLVFDKQTGQFESYLYRGRELFHQTPYRGTKGFRFEVYRAPLDNDMKMRKNWERMGLDKIAYRVKNCAVTEQEGKVVIKVKYEGNTPIRYIWSDFVAHFTAVYTIFADGRILVDNSLMQMMGIRNLPRFGVSLEVPEEYERIQYYGLGEQENLSDFRAHAILGVFETKAGEMHELYLKPQESGMRGETRWMCVTNEAGDGLRIDYQDRYLSVNASHYTTAQLARCGHTEDVKDYDTTCLQLDGYLMGAGSNSCGPKPLKQYRLPRKKPLSFSFLMTPLTSVAEEAETAADEETVQEAEKEEG